MELLPCLPVVFIINSTDFLEGTVPNIVMIMVEMQSSLRELYPILSGLWWRCRVQSSLSETAVLCQNVAVLCQNVNTTNFYIVKMHSSPREQLISNLWTFLGELQPKLLREYIVARRKGYISTTLLKIFK